MLVSPHTQDVVGWVYTALLPDIAAAPSIFPSSLAPTLGICAYKLVFVVDYMEGGGGVVLC